MNHAYAYAYAYDLARATNATEAIFGVYTSIVPQLRADLDRGMGPLKAASAQDNAFTEVLKRVKVIDLFPSKKLTEIYLACIASRA